MQLKYFSILLILFLNIPKIIAQTDSENKNPHQVYYDLDKVQFEIREFLKQQPTKIPIYCENEESIKKGIENRNKKINYLNSPHLISLCQKEYELMNKINGGSDIENALCNSRKLQIEDNRKDIKNAKECLERLKNKPSNNKESNSYSKQSNSKNSNSSHFNKEYFDSENQPESQKKLSQNQQAQRAREAQRKAGEAQAQRIVAASQQQSQQTMANMQRASNLISGVFESQYQRIEMEAERERKEIERRRETEQREREARYRREEERERKVAEERKIKNAKSSFLSSIADVKIPLFFDSPQAYALFVSKTGSETIKIIPATLYKNTDNQLPYKIDVIKKIKAQHSLTNLNTHGVYSSYEQLQAEVNQLYSSAQNNYINVTKEKQIEFGKKQTNASSNEDFWGTQQPKTKPKSKKTDDFWN